MCKFLNVRLSILHLLYFFITCSFRQICNSKLMCKIGLLLQNRLVLSYLIRSSFGKVWCDLLISLSKPKDANSILRSCCRFLWPLYLLISCNEGTSWGLKKKKSVFVLKNLSCKHLFKPLKCLWFYVTCRRLVLMSIYNSLKKVGIL